MRLWMSCRKWYESAEKATYLPLIGGCSPHSLLPSCLIALLLLLVQQWQSFNDKWQSPRSDSFQPGWQIACQLLLMDSNLLLMEDVQIPEGLSSLAHPSPHPHPHSNTLSFHGPNVQQASVREPSLFFAPIQIYFAFSVEITLVWLNKHSVVICDTQTLSTWWCCQRLMRCEAYESLPILTLTWQIMYECMFYGILMYMYTVVKKRNHKEKSFQLSPTTMVLIRTALCS